MTTKKPPMPEWLQTSLIADGTMTAAKITHHTQTRNCPHCQRACLAAIPAWETPAAWLDPQPLTPTTELAALMAGHTTYDHHTGEGIEQRFAHDIKDAPANKGTVHREHKCGAPPLPTIAKNKPDQVADPPY